MFREYMPGINLGKYVQLLQHGLRSLLWRGGKHGKSLLWRHMTVIKSQNTSHSTVCLTAFADLHQWNIKVRHYWPFVRGIHRWPVNSPHKGSVTRKNLPFFVQILFYVGRFLVHTERSMYVIMFFADALALNRHQATSNHYTHWSVTHELYIKSRVIIDK